MVREFLAGGFPSRFPKGMGWAALHVSKMSAVEDVDKNAIKRKLNDAEYTLKDVAGESEAWKTFKKIHDGINYFSLKGTQATHYVYCTICQDILTHRNKDETSGILKHLKSEKCKKYRLMTLSPAPVQQSLNRFYSSQKLNREAVDKVTQSVLAF